MTNDAAAKAKQRKAAAIAKQAKKGRKATGSHISAMLNATRDANADQR